MGDDPSQGDQYRSTPIPAPGIPTPTIRHRTADRQFQNTAPEFALVYKRTTSGISVARVATGYGTPQVGNLFVLPNGQNGNNTQLKTQKNLGYDLGFDWTPNNTFKVSATGFYEFFRDELVTQATPGRRAQLELYVQRAEIRAPRLRTCRRLEVLSRLAVYGRLYLSRSVLHRIHREHQQWRRLQLQSRGQQDPRHFAERTDGTARL